MVDWEKYSFRTKILCVFLVIYIILYFIFWYLIKSHNMKPNKFTRLFYEDDEQFVKKWEKEKSKSQLEYFITTTCKFCVLYTIALLVFLNFDFITIIKEKWFVFLGTLMGYIIGVPIGWAIRDDKYSRIIEIKNNDIKPDEQSDGEDIDG